MGSAQRERGRGLPKPGKTKDVPTRGIGAANLFWPTRRKILRIHPSVPWAHHAALDSVHAISQNHANACVFAADFAHYRAKRTPSPDWRFCHSHSEIFGPVVLRLRACPCVRIIFTVLAYSPSLRSVRASRGGSSFSNMNSICTTNSRSTCLLHAGGFGQCPSAGQLLQSIACLQHPMQNSACMCRTDNC